jgi:hypothetical protein
LLTLALFTTGYAQTLDKAKLDQFFDRLAEKNKAMGSLTIAKDGNVLYTRAIGYSQINGTEKKPLTAASRFRLGSDHKDVHCHDDLTTRRGRKIEADGYPGQVPPAGSERREDYHRADPLASQRHP